LNAQPLRKLSRFAQREINVGKPLQAVATQVQRYAEPQFPDSLRSCGASSLRSRCLQRFDLDVDVRDRSRHHGQARLVNQIEIDLVKRDSPRSIS
jgi:hypothetical protein